ncbi:hypothetical protein EGI20_14495 [Aquitalea sp. S1-19]|nr:hypothetical protein [Aquitalea sp. S1-19]
MPAAIDFLRQAGVVVTLSGANKLTATGYLTDDIRQFIREYKPAIITELTTANDLAPQPPRPSAHTVLPFRLVDARGGTYGGTVRGDDLTELVLALVERYGALLDIEDLLERIHERFAIVAESAPDAEALRIALAEAEAAIRRAMAKR